MGPDNIADKGRNIGKALKKIIERGERVWGESEVLPSWDVIQNSTPQIDRGSERFYSLGMKVAIGSIAGYAVGLYLMDQNSTINTLLNMVLQPISVDLLDKANDIRKTPLHLFISAAVVVGIVCFDKVPES